VFTELLHNNCRGADPVENSLSVIEARLQSRCLAMGILVTIFFSQSLCSQCQMSSFITITALTYGWKYVKKVAIRLYNDINSVILRYSRPQLYILKYKLLFLRKPKIITISTTVRRNTQSRQFTLLQPLSLILALMSSSQVHSCSQSSPLLLHNFNFGYVN
jgi:hypothetical protein